MSDVETALAFVARREGRTSMPESRWAHVLSLELGWLDPTRAKAWVAAALSTGILQSSGEELAFTRDPTTVPIARGFRPDPTAPLPTAPAAHDESFPGWVTRVSLQRQARQEEVLAEVAALQDKMGGMLTADAAILWLARDAGLDVRRALENQIRSLRINGNPAEAPRRG